MSRFQIAAGISALLGVIAIAFFLWVVVTPRRWDAPDVAYCRELYQSAATRADSARVDGAILPNQGKRQASALTCGVLRVAYPDLFAGQVSRK